MSAIGAIRLEHLGLGSGLVPGGWSLARVAGPYLPVIGVYWLRVGSVDIGRGRS